MSERGLAKEAVNIAFIGMLLYWAFFTKSGRIFLLIMFLIGAFQGQFYPDMSDIDPNELNSPMGLCIKDARQTWGSEGHVKLIACYNTYAKTYDWTH